MRIVAILLGLVLAAGIVYAAEAKEEGAFWQNLRKKTERIVPGKKMVITSAVGGVRGRKTEADDLYWKGKMLEQEIEVTAEELSRFNAAVDLASRGEHEKARQSLEAFISEYPKSSLGEDAHQALQYLQQPPEVILETATEPVTAPVTAPVPAPAK